MNDSQKYVSIIREQSVRLDPIPTDVSESLHKLPAIEAVLFDVYGTLFISASGEHAGGRHGHEEAIGSCFSSVGLKIPERLDEAADTLHQVIQTQHERSRKAGVDFPEVDILEVWRMTLDALCRRGSIEANPEQTDLAELSLRFELATNPVWPMPGVRESLMQLVGRRVQLGLISNAQWYTPLLFPALLGGEAESLGVDREMQFWSYRDGWAKPSEYLFRHAKDALLKRGIRPESVLLVGNDLLNDIVPASRVGFRTALFAGDRRSLRMRDGDPRVAGIAPDLVVLNLESIVTSVRPHVPE
jgi:putative hydrolase of the HAD superfamily